MTRFEALISIVGSDSSNNCTTTIARPKGYTLYLTKYVHEFLFLGGQILQVRPREAAPRV